MTESTDGVPWTDGAREWADENQGWSDGEERWVDGGLEAGADPVEPVEPADGGGTNVEG
jgi:hypothetical protein